MIRPIAICTGAAVAVIGAWTVLASRLFVWIGGLSAHFPSPWGTWWRYAWHTQIDSLTLAYLVASGVIAALPILLIGVAVAILILRRMRKSSALYGETGWATETQMRAGSISASQKPF